METKAIGRMTAEEAHELGICVAAYSVYPVLDDPEEFARIYAEYKEGTDERRRRRAFDRIVYGNIRLAIPYVRRYAGRGLSAADMFQEGVMGIHRALVKYELERGNRFSTYAVWWIRSCILRAVYTQATRPPFNIPHSARKRLNDIRRAVAWYEREFQREPSAQEVSAMIGRPEPSSFVEDRTEDMMQLLTLRAVPFEAKKEGFRGDESRSLEEKLALDAPTAEKMLNDRQVFQQLEKALHRLPRKSAEIIKCRFGLGGRPPQTLEEIGQRYGLTRERIRQIEVLALKELSKLLPHTLRQSIL